MTSRFAILSCIVLLALSWATFAQQVPDLHFNSRVDEPAYKKDYPRVLFDEAHNNPLTAAGSYKPFADLIFSDGYQLIVNRKPFSKESLRSAKILIIVNGLGAEEVDDEGADQSAFTETEVNFVHDWVRGGGSLLLIADGGAYASSIEILTKRLAVEMSKATTSDLPNSAGNASTLVFSRENKLLGEHPIVRGRNDSESLKKVLTFAGQSLKGPEDAEVFLKLSPTAVDGPATADGKGSSAANRAQGIAFRAGKGRVVMLADASMLTAQIEGLEQTPVGMNVSSADNRQLALNIMHWLSGILK